MSKVVMNPDGEKVLELLVTNYLQTLAHQIVRQAKDICPVDTGNLRDSIKVLNERKNEIDIGSEVHYANYVESGTRNQMAQPYLRPALDIVVNDNK